MMALLRRKGLVAYSYQHAGWHKSWRSSMDRGTAWKIEHGSMPDSGQLTITSGKIHFGVAEGPAKGEG